MTMAMTMMVTMMVMMISTALMMSDCEVGRDRPLLLDPF
jgi:hypothetical protein